VEANDLIPDADRSTSNHFGIERQLVVEPPHDVAQHTGVHLQRVRIDRRHVTSSA
jgi:hypothetical protein